MQESVNPNEEQILFGKVALMGFETLPATFNLVAFNAVYSGPWEELEGRMHKASY